MLIECANDDDCFVLSGSSLKTHDDEPPWLMITRRHRRGWSYPKDKINKFAIYLGTKKETGVTLEYCDKFVLIGNQIAGVDPAAWCRIRAVDENR